MAFVDLEERVPATHPLRVIKRFADRALAELSPTLRSDVWNWWAAIDPARAMHRADALGLPSDQHVTVDGTLIESAASLKSFRPKDGPPSSPPPDDPGNPTVNFRGEKRSNATHQSTTDPEARLAKKGGGFEAKLAYMGHARKENRYGVLVEARYSTRSVRSSNRASGYIGR